MKPSWRALVSATETTRSLNEPVGLARVVLDPQLAEAELGGQAVGPARAGCSPAPRSTGSRVDDRQQVARSARWWAGPAAIDARVTMPRDALVVVGDLERAEAEVADVQRLGRVGARALPTAQPGDEVHDGPPHRSGIGTWCPPDRRMHWLPRRHRARPSAALDDPSIVDARRRPVNARRRLLESHGRARTTLPGPSGRFRPRRHGDSTRQGRRTGDDASRSCLPARDEGATVGAIVRAVVQPFLRDAGGIDLVDELLVRRRRLGATTPPPWPGDAGARVVAGPGGAGGKGQAMAAAPGGGLGRDVVVFLDADVRTPAPHFVTRLVGPAARPPTTSALRGQGLLRPAPARRADGRRPRDRAGGPAGHRPAVPRAGGVRQPLAGETAAPPLGPREARASPPATASSSALLIDVAQRFGVEPLAQVDLGVRVHRNRPLTSCGPGHRRAARRARARIRSCARRAGRRGRPTRAAR